MEFDIKKIKDNAEKDWYKTWKETSKELEGKGKFELPKERGKEHILSKYLLKIREVLLDLGFEEVILNPIIEVTHIKKQYGPEAPAILDRIYYLATLPRPDIGLSEKKKKLILEKIPNFNKFEELKQILRKYKLGEIEGSEDFTETLIRELNLTQEEALFLIDKVFVELKEIKPLPTNLTLLSHATSAWFPVLAHYQKIRKLPICLFSMVWRFRREQRDDATHLKAHKNISMVVMDKDLKIENGIEITKELFKKLGFNEVKFELKPSQAAYYAYNTNYEVFIKHDNKWLEVTEIGMYNPISLANYGIKYPVFNSGPGLGRIAMALENIKDIRQLYYPYLFEGIELNDEELANSLRIKEMPKQEYYKKLVEILKEAIIKHKDDLGVCKIKVYEDDNLDVYLLEPEEGKKLLGPAGLNEVYVYEGNIIAILPKDERFKEIEEKGIRVCSFLEAICNYIFAKVEKGEEGIFTIKYVDTLPSLNLELDELAERFITSKNREIKIKGPVFLDVEVRKKR